MRRVVLDTNVLVSATLNPQGAPAAVVAALIEGRFTSVTSQPLVDEYVEVMTRPRISERRALDASWVERVRVALLDSPDHVPVLGTLRLCRDPDDDIVLETAIRGGADTLVSRDDDLTRAPDVSAALARHGIATMTMRQFLAVLDAERG
ncbi:MAG: putative toxin-antitoxin system toxin component, PIN family [Chloroflexi bacterium]|nr:putative toxin-antitoxin system toxin component, PIN family [Chloroflexota bacterium]